MWCVFRSPPKENGASENNWELDDGGEINESLQENVTPQSSTGQRSKKRVKRVMDSDSERLVN